MLDACMHAKRCREPALTGWLRSLCLSIRFPAGKDGPVKYAFMTFSCPDYRLEQVFEAARTYGYDGVEFRIDAKHAHGIEVGSEPGVRARAARLAGQTGVRIACVATSCRYADPAVVAEMVESTRAALDLAADLGAPRLRVFGGAIPEGRPREQAIRGVADALASVAEHAARRGVVVCMETHDHWCDPAHVAAVMKAVNHPFVAVNWDIMHPVRVAGATMDQAFETLRPWIRHVHFHDGVTEAGKLLMRPIGTGAIDHFRAVQLLKTMPYPDFLSGEWIGWEPPEIHLPRELAAMRAYEARA
jgi:sugar phosphate isomerase/epimerase